MDDRSVAALPSSEVGHLPSHLERLKVLVRPRLLSAADSGLMCEHFALEMGRETKKAASDCSVSTGETDNANRQRAMTWQMAVNPFLQPEYTAVITSNIDWAQIWEVPTFSWLDTERSRTAGIFEQEWSPLNGPAGAASPSRSRFWSEQMHDRTPKSRRGDATSTSSPNFFNGDIGGLTPGGHLLSVVEEDEDEVAAAISRPLPWGRRRSQRDTRNFEAISEAQRALPPLEVGYL